MNKKLAKSLYVTAISMAAVCSAVAQADTATAIKKLEDQVKIIELENKVDSLQQSGLLALLPKSGTKGLDGKITLDKEGDFYRKISIHSSLVKLFGQCDLSGLGSVTDVYFFSDGFDQNKIGLVRAYKSLLVKFDTSAAALLREADNLEAASQNAINSADPSIGRFGIVEVSTIIGAASGVLGSVSDIAGYFKTDKVYENEAVTVQPIEVAVLLQPKLKQSNRRLVIPGLAAKQASALFDAYGTTRNNATKLKSAKDKAIKLNKDYVAGNADKIRTSTELIAKLEADLKKADANTSKAIEQSIKAEKNKLAELSSRKDVSAVVDGITKWLDEYAKVESELVEKQSNGGYLLAQLIAYENYSGSQNSALLTISVASAGAASVVTSNKFRNDQLNYLSGLRVFGTITDKDGGVLVAFSEAPVASSTEKQAFGVESVISGSSRGNAGRKSGPR